LIKILNGVGKRDIPRWLLQFYRGCYDEEQQTRSTAVEVLSEFGQYPVKGTVF
jgi:hypothetical protein